MGFGGTPSSIATKSAPMLIRRWRGAGKAICTDHRTSLRSTVELRSEIRVKEFAELRPVLHVVCSIPPHSPELAEGWPFFAVCLKPDKIHKIAGDVVVRDGFLAKNGFIIVL